MTRSFPFRRFCVVAFTVAVAACDLPADDQGTDPWVDLADRAQGVTLECASATVCSDPSGTSGLYTSTYRIGTSDTSRGELVQVFKPAVSGTPANVRVRLTTLRSFQAASGVTPYLHAEVYAVTGTTTAELTGAPIAEGTYDLTQPRPSSSDVTVVFSDASALTADQRYGLRLYADEGATGGTGTTLLGIGAHISSTYADGEAWRRSVRRTTAIEPFAEARLRPAGSWDVAFALVLTTTPDAPTNVVAVGGNASATVSWDAPAQEGGSPVSSYTVTAQPGGSQQSTANGSTTSLVFTGLTNGVSYTFTVVANNGQGSSAASDASAPVMPRTVPTAPQDLVVSAVGHTVQLSWTAPADTGGAAITDYLVSRATGAGGPFTQIGNVLAFTYEDTGLDAGTRYHYTVAAVNAVGAGAGASGNAITAPAAPPTLGATGGAGSVNLTWTPTVGSDSYVVLRSTTSGSGYVQVGTSATNAYTDTGLSAGTDYFYVIAAVNAGGTSAGSAQAGALTAPPAPTGVVASGGLQQIAITWTATPGALTYDVLHGNTSGGAYSFLANVSSAAYTHTSLGGGSTHYYVVRAINGSGTSGQSAEASATTAPPAPATVTATGGTLSVILNWGAAATATSYTVRRSTTNGGPYTAVGTTSALSFNDTTAAAGTTSYYVVAATSGAGTGVDSAQVSALTSPPAPTGLTAGGGVANVALAWTAAPGASTYNVLRSATSGTGYASLATGVATNSYTDTGLGSGVTFYYVVQAVNATGTSANSAEAGATTTVTARKSCLAWYNAGSTVSTTYLIDPDGTNGNPPFTVYCDMSTTYGGGWTLAVGITTGYHHPQTGAVGTLLAPGQSARLSDAVINQIKDGSNPAYRLDCGSMTGFWPATCNFSSTADASGACVQMASSWNGSYAGSTVQGSHVGVADGSRGTADRLIFGRTDLNQCDNNAGWGSNGRGNLWVR